jgi:ribosomal protein S18 acetylase RimI-like enzyme
MDLCVRPFAPADEPAVIELWRRCGLLRPWNDPHRDIAIKYAHSPELFLVGTLEGRLVAAAMIGYDGHRGWVSYLGVEPTLQRRGLGRQLMAEAERRLRELGCPKLNLQVRNSNLAVVAFYKAIGFGDDQVIGLGKRLDQVAPGS